MPHLLLFPHQGEIIGSTGGPPYSYQPIGKYHVSFYSAPHQLQTNGLNLIRLFNSIALKFDTSSDHKKTISPLKCFKPCIVSPLEQNTSIQNSLSLSLGLKLSLFTAQPLARIFGSDDTGLFLIGKSLKSPLVQSPNIKNFPSSSKPCCTWDTSVNSP